MVQREHDREPWRGNRMGLQTQRAGRTQRGQEWRNAGPKTEPEVISQRIYSTPYTEGVIHSERSWTLKRCFGKRNMLMMIKRNALEWEDTKCASFIHLFFILRGATTMLQTPDHCPTVYVRKYKKCEVQRGWGMCSTSLMGPVPRLVLNRSLVSMLTLNLFPLAC